MAAVLILELHADELRSEDLRLIELLICESRTCALVDVLSGDVVGEMGLRLRRHALPQTVCHPDGSSLVSPQIKGRHEHAGS